MRFDKTDPGWSGHVKRRDGLATRLHQGMTACMWGAWDGLAWEMLRLVGRHGRVWAQEPDPVRTEQARDFFLLPNLTWCDRPSVEMPPWPHVDVCVIDWVPYGGDRSVLERLRGWHVLDKVSSIMTEQRDDDIMDWMRDHGFRHAPDSQPYHEWWDRR